MNEQKWKSRWTTDQVKTILLEQHRNFCSLDTGIQRDKLEVVGNLVSAPHAVIISGLRRVGKSTLLAQLGHQLGVDQFYYVNFEDDRFIGFGASDAQDLYAALLEIFGERKIFFMDEVQNIPGWEHFVRRLMDAGIKFFITGSNASLLSQDLGTRLTGRYLSVELFPFSFSEYIRFKSYSIPDRSQMMTLEKARLRQILNEYLVLGGIPDHLKYPELPILRTLYDDVLYRDIATRYRVQEISALRDLSFYLMSNIGNPISFNRLKEQFRLGSVNTIKNYIEYLEKSWLIFSVNVYDYSVKRQQIAPKKIYSIDTGLSKTIGFSFSSNTGKAFENLVYLALRRKHQNFYYFTTPLGFEVDFFIPEKRQLIQVAQNLNQIETRQREIRSLQDAMRSLKISTALILSGENEDPVEMDECRIEIRSLSEWLLDMP